MKAFCHYIQVGLSSPFISWWPSSSTQGSSLLFYWSQAEMMFTLFLSACLSASSFFPPSLQSALSSLTSSIMQAATQRWPQIGSQWSGSPPPPWPHPMSTDSVSIALGSLCSQSTPADCLRAEVDRVRVPDGTNHCRWGSGNAEVAAIWREEER